MYICFHQVIRESTDQLKLQLQQVGRSAIWSLITVTPSWEPSFPHAHDQARERAASAELRQREYESQAQANAQLRLQVTSLKNDASVAQQELRELRPFREQTHKIEEKLRQTLVRGNNIFGNCQIVSKLLKCQIHHTYLLTVRLRFLVVLVSLLSCFVIFYLFFVIYSYTCER